MNCVVCGGGLGTDAYRPESAHYANAWERTRGLSPCCSDGCARLYDPDVHWIPAVFPIVVEGDQAIRLRQMARQRLGQLDEARPVVRELLLAGLAPTILRFLVAQANDATRELAQRATKRTVLGVLSGFLGGSVTVAESRDARSDDNYTRANDDLDLWEARVVARA